MFSFFSYWIPFWIFWNYVNGFWDAEKECPDFVEPQIFFSSDKVATGLPRRAFDTTPEGFSINQSMIPGAGLGVFSTSAEVPKGVWLGEYQGDFVPLNFTSQHRRSYAWLLYNDGCPSHYVDASDTRMSNWLRFINCARHVTEQNVGHSLCYGRIYYKAIQDIRPGQELLVYYGCGYAKTLGIDVANYHNPRKFSNGR